jgi:hypothetical protein
MSEASSLVAHNVGFGTSSHWQMPFSLQCRLLGSSRHFSVLGRTRLHHSLVHLLSVRLRLELLKKKIQMDSLPNIDEKMCFVIGLPRCGSTLVHNLMSFDSASACFDFAEMHDPSHAVVSRDVKARLEKLKKAMPMLSKKANLKEGKKEDDSFLMQLSFLNPVLALACRETNELRNNCCFVLFRSLTLAFRYRDWMYSANLKPFYEELKLLYRVIVCFLFLFFFFFGFD